MTISAPVGGELHALQTQSTLAPGSLVARGDVLLKLVPFASIDRDVRARVEREQAVTAAQLVAAESRVARLSQAGADQAVSRRAYEEAVAARDILRADVRAAEARAQTTRAGPLLSDVALTIKAPGDGVVRALSVAPGQAVAAGTALLELVAVEALQVRVPVYAGDLSRFDASVGVRVRALSAPPEAAVVAMPVLGPPTAAPERATVDRYFALGRGALFAPGERVLVELSLRSEQSALSVPRAAVIYDASGAAWVYACESKLAFQRARIDPLRLAGERIVFTRGPSLGSCVASVGAAEIFGSEFEPGH
jgi:multidrug efflux pump subunit AcrA (membrane-fusion protein)